MMHIGIDPGGAGGLALVAPGCEPVAVRMPETERDIVDQLEAWLDAGRGMPARAAIEHVWSTPGQGGAFKFGKSVGTLLGILTALRIPFDQVLPRTWQKAMGVAYPPGSTDTEKKNITKRRAQQLFPELTITHATADALLIAYYCRRSHAGSIDGKEEGTRAQEPTEARGAKGKGREAGRASEEAGQRATELTASNAPRHGRRAHPSPGRHRGGNR